MCCFPTSAEKLNNSSMKCWQPHFPWTKNSQPQEVLILTISSMSMLLRTVCCGTHPQFQQPCAEFSPPYRFCELGRKTDVTLKTITWLNSNFISSIRNAAICSTFCTLKCEDLDTCTATCLPHNWPQSGYSRKVHCIHMLLMTFLKQQLLSVAKGIQT